MKIKTATCLILFSLFCSLNAFSDNGVDNVKEYDAIGDGETLYTTSIQKTIDACTEQEGGKVIVPP